MMNSLIEKKFSQIITDIARHYSVSRLQIKVEILANKVILKHYDGNTWNILDEFPSYSLFLRKWNT